MREPQVSRLVALVAAGAMTLAACTAGAEGKSGAEPARTTLVLATGAIDLTGVPGVQYFVDRLDARSGGRLTIRVATRWAIGEEEATVLKDVAAGRADLGSTGTRALDQVGVRALTPVHAPFLVDSYAGQKAVLADRTVTEQLDELRSAGLVGVALIADHLRLPVGTAGPLLSAEDYSGAVIKTFGSDVQADGLRVLGARPSTDALSETMDGGEVSWDLFRGDGPLGVAQFVTANTPIWPRSLVIVAHPASLEGLTDQEREWVRAAGADAARWSLDHARDQEVAEIAQACSKGVKVAYADAGQVASLKEAVEPLYQTLRDDPETAAVMHAVERLMSGLPPDSPPVVPVGCEFRPGDESLAAPPPEQLTAPGRSEALPEGVYRYELTEDELRATGLIDEDIYGNAGVWTWTLGDGRWSYVQLPANPGVPNTTCEGYYDVTGSDVVLSVATLVQIGECAPLRWTMTWSSTTDTLTWSDVSISDLAPIFAGKPWDKIG